MKDRECVQCGSVVQVLSAREDVSFCPDCDWDDLPVLDVSGQDRQSDFPEYLVNECLINHRWRSLRIVRRSAVPLENRVEVLRMVGYYTDLERKVDEMRVYMRDNPHGLYAYKAAARSSDETLDEIGSWNGLRREAGEWDLRFRERIMGAIVAKHDREVETMRVVVSWNEEVGGED